MYKPQQQNLSHAPYQHLKLPTNNLATNNTNRTSTHNHTQHRYTIKDWCENIFYLVAQIHRLKAILGAYSGIIYISLAVSYTNILIGKRAIGTYPRVYGEICGEIAYLIVIIIPIEYVYLLKVMPRRRLELPRP